MSEVADGLLAGLRVVEMGFWVAGPAAAGLLADWGADVVKIEPPRGDPMRQFYRAIAGLELPGCPGFDLDNRGKRSVSRRHRCMASSRPMPMECRPCG